MNAGFGKHWPTQPASLPRPLARIVRRIDDVLGLFWDNPWLYAVLVLAALWAGIWGFTAFYGPQFARTPAWSWPFVPDSPLATTLWLAASVWIKAGLDDRPGTLARVLTWCNHLVIVWNVRTGLWTVFVLLYHYDHFFGAGGTQTAIQWMLVAAHFGMVAFALQIFRKTHRMGPLGWLTLTAFVFLFDFVDYGLVPLFMPDSGIQLFPNGVPSDPETLRVVAAVAFGLSTLALYMLAIASRLRGAVDRSSTSQRVA